MNATGSQSFLPVLLLDCDALETMEARPIAQPVRNTQIQNALNAINSFQNPQDAVDSIIKAAHERYGFGEVAQFFNRLAETLKSNGQELQTCP